MAGATLRLVFAGLATLCLAACEADSTLASAAKSAPGQPVVLFAPLDASTTYLMNMDGEKVHQWDADTLPGYSAYLLPKGHLLRAGSLPDRPLQDPLGTNGGRVEILDWDSNVLWRYDYATRTGQQHHDVFWMEKSGHVLLVAWEARTAEEALAAGRDLDTIPPGGEIWVDKIVEVDIRASQVVWEWRVWDHLVPPGESPADHPGLIDPNYVAAPIADWTHANAIAYNEDLDQVMLSVRSFSELWVIDHSTTTEEAAGHTGGRLGRGGDLVYRWGNPGAYGVRAPQQMYAQHNAHWVEAGLPGAGNILVFDNGEATVRAYSTVVELQAPRQTDGSYAYGSSVGFGPPEPLSRYVANPPQSLFAPIISGAQRLRSGNTVITDGPAGRFFEVTPEGDTVWSYVVTDTAGGTGYFVFRATRYEADYPGLAGRDLAPQGPVRLAPLAAGAGAARNAY